jgi:hypothetical protein
MIRTNDRATIRVHGSGRCGARLGHDCLVAIDNQCACDREVIVQQGHSFVPSLSQNAILHVDRAVEAIEHVITASDECTAAHSNRPAGPIVDVEAILVVWSAGVALTVIGKDELNVRIFCEKRGTILELGARNHSRDQGPIHGDITCPAGIDRFGGAIGKNAII